MLIHTINEACGSPSVLFVLLFDFDVCHLYNARL
jgi:hypothetical protein